MKSYLLAFVCLSMIVFSCNEKKELSLKDNKINSAIGLVNKDSILPPEITMATPPQIVTFTKTVAKGNDFTAGNGRNYFISLTPEQGYKISNVIDLFFDNAGMVWMAEETDLLKYDGIGFTRFGLKNGIEASSITSFAQDDHGDLWITRTNGISRYNGHVFTNYDKADISKGGGSFKGLKKDNKGNIWFIINRKGICKYDGESFTTYTTQQGLPSDTIENLMVDRQGKLWLKSSHGDVWTFDGKTYKAFSEMDPELSKAIYSFFQDLEGNIWFCTFRNGVVKFDGKNFIQFTSKNGLPSENIRDATQDSTGNIWFATDNGVSRFDGTHFTNYTTEHGLSNNLISHIYTDLAGNIWTSGWGGLNKINGTYISHYTVVEGFKGTEMGFVNFINDRNGNLWFTILGGIGKYDGQEFSYYSKTGTNILETRNNLGSLFLDKDGSIWFSTDDKGCYRFDGKTFLFYPEINTGFDGIFQDSKGIYWFTNFRTGLTKYDGTLFTHYTTAQGLPDNHGASFAEDRSGNIFITTTNGFSKFDGSHFTNYTTNQNLDYGYSSYRLIADKQGQIWYASDSGLVKYDGHSFTYFETSDGLANATIDKIIEDTVNKKLWLTTGYGLSAINTELKNQNTGKETVENYNFQTGFHELSKQFNGIIQDHEGVLWLSETDKSLTRFDYQQLKKYPVPELLIKNVILDNETISWHNLLHSGLANKIYDSLAVMNEVNIRFQKPLSVAALKDMSDRFTGVAFDSISPGNLVPIHLEIPYRQNNIGFEFAAIDPANASQVKYQYMLEGYNNFWSNPDYTTKANFGNMKEGNYTFRLKALSPNGQWTETSYSFKVMPPWYRTWLAYSLYILLAAIIIYFINRREVKRHRIKNERILKQKEAEQVMAMDGIKTRFFSNITHEFRTPLTMIISPVDELLKEKGMPTPYKKTLSIVQRNANQLLGLINQLLDLSKLEAGKMQVSMKRGDIGMYLTELAENFIPYALQKNLELQINNEVKAREYLFDAGKWEKIINNLLSNAIKFTEANGKIEVSILENPDGEKHIVSLLVKDTGVGIEPEKLQHIFDRFYQSDTTATRKYEGTGIGLALVKEFVDLMDGAIRVESKLSEGTSIHVNIPVAIAVNKETAAMIIPEKTAILPVDIIPLTVGEVINSTDEAPLILVTEDNPELKAFIVSSLQKKYRVIHADNGLDAWQLCQNEIPDIVLSDVMMPGMDGNELCAAIKTNPLTAHIAVIMLTAKAASSSIIEGLSSGADDYITKPFQVDELLLRIQNRLQRLEKLKQYFRAHLAEPENKIDEAVMQDEFVQSMYNIIEEYIDDTQLGVEFLATKMALSRRTLNRKLSAVLGLPPSEIIKQYRLKKGAEMLRSGFNISETAYRSGFESPSYFGQCFKDHYGLTPSDYIEKSRV